MGEIQKINGEYFIEFYARGLKYQQKAGPDRAAAEKLLLEVETKISQGEMGVMVRDVELDIFFRDFMEFIQPGHTTQTVERYRALTRSFAEFLRETPEVKRLSQITPKVVENYRLFLERRFPLIKPRVLHFRFFLLSDILQYGIKLGYIHDDATLHIRLPALRLAGPHTLTDEEVRQLMELLSGELGDLSRLMLWTGMSVVETVGLRWEAVDLNRPAVTVGEDKDGSRYGRKREIPLEPAAVALLRERKKTGSSELVFVARDGQPLNAADMEARLAEVLRQIADDEPRTPIVLRHNFVLNLVRRGVRWSRLYQILGFADIAMMVRYFSFKSGSSIPYYFYVP